MNPHYKFTIEIKLDKAACGYGNEPLARIKLEETVPADVEPVEYIRGRLTEEYERKLGNTTLDPAGLPED